MKLLLTSGGITNDSIVNALFDLVGKKPEDTSLAFIPTAAHEEHGDKSWLIDDLARLKERRFRSIDIAEIAIEDKSVWLPKLEAADILFFGGGNPYYLMEHLNRSGLATFLPKLLEERVYVGLSAGSMVAGNNLALEASQVLYEEDLDRTEEMPGLGFVDFCILPHLNSPHFEKLREKEIRAVAQKMQKAVYALDDNSAVRVVAGTVSVVSEGEWFVVQVSNIRCLTSKKQNLGNQVGNISYEQRYYC